jgi:hypothetical protein
MPLQLLVLALDSALYPTLLAAVVILLNQPRRVRLLSAYLAGGLTISVGLGLGLVLALKSSGALHNSRSELSWTIDLAVGGLVLLIAVALATRADARFAERRKARQPVDPKFEMREPISQRILARGSAPIVFIAALAINLPGASYIVALKDIAAAHHPTVEDIVLVLVFNLIMFLLAEIPLVGLIINPTRTEELVRRVDAWSSRNGRRIAIALCLVLSAFLIVRGIAKA